MIRTRLKIGAVLVLVAASVAFSQGAMVKAASVGPTKAESIVSAKPAMRVVPVRGDTHKPPPVQLRARLEQLAQGFDGKVGISVRDVADSWSAGLGGDAMLPQQSVSKLWVAVTLLDAVDRGVISLDEVIIVKPADLTLFNQPVRALVGDDGHATTLGRLLTRALVDSDNTANDVLLRRVGGPAAVKAMLRRKGLAAIAFGPGERVQQSTTAGLVWDPAYSDAGNFRRARAELPMDARKQALEAYLAAPPDGASPDGIARALAALQKGMLLSPASSTLLLDTMAASRTGRSRLRAGLGKGWHLAHKTGTGQELGSLATGFNDVGLLTARDGRVYAVAVMISHSRAPIKARQALIADVARTVVAYSELPPTGAVLQVAGASDAGTTRKGAR